MSHKQNRMNSTTMFIKLTFYANKNPNIFIVRIFVFLLLMVVKPFLSYLQYYSFVKYPDFTDLIICAQENELLIFMQKLSYGFYNKPGYIYFFKIFLVIVFPALSSILIKYIPALLPDRSISILFCVPPIFCPYIL